MVSPADAGLSYLRNPSDRPCSNDDRPGPPQAEAAYNRRIPSSGLRHSRPEWQSPRPQNAS